MDNVSQQLQNLLPPEQLQQLQAVRQRLLEDPKALDTHSREKRNGQVSEEQAIS